jgi:hypothetical protein
MDEVIYKIDNWTIIKIVGGLGLTISAIMALFGKLILEKFKITWAKNSSIDLQNLKYEIEKNNKAVDNLQSNFLNHQQKGYDKRVDAIETLWISINEINDGIPSVVSLCLRILTDNEINNSTLDKANTKGISLGSLVMKLDESKDTTFLVGPANKVTLLRPFINEDLYSLFRTYTAIVGRITHTFIWNYKKSTLTTWKNDEHIKTLLKEVLNEEEFRHIYNKQVGSFDDMTNLLELKMLAMMRNSISGTDISIDTVKQIKRLEEIWKVEQK